MDTTIEEPESNMKNGMVSSSSQYKTKVTSLRRMVRGARQSMERRGDRDFNSKKRTKHKEEPIESETQETTLSESVREVGLEGQFRHTSQRREIPFRRVLEGMPFLREDSEVSLGSVGASLKRMGSKRAMLADSSWGKIQTSMRGFGTDSL